MQRITLKPFFFVVEQKKSNMSSAYVFIMSSLNHPVYRTLQKKRRHLLETYGLPYTVVMNGEVKAVNSTYPPVEDDEVFYPLAGYNPSMTLKFLFAVKMFFRSFRRWEDVPNYIVRLNATVYIHFPSLMNYLQQLPREKVLAGPVIRAPDATFVNGMIMIFSKDVLRNMLSDKRIHEQKLLHKYDDVALSLLARPYGEYHDMMPYFVYGTTCENSSPDGVYDLKRIEPYKWMFRIRHETSKRRSDVLNWDRLMAHFDKEVPESFTSISTLATPLHNHYSLGLWIFLCIVGILVILCLVYCTFS